jgi:hypothetical protein
MPVREKSQALAEYRCGKTTFTIDTMKEFILWNTFSFPAARSRGMWAETTFRGRTFRYDGGIPI